VDIALDYDKREDAPTMHLLMSWARSTVANLDYKLGRTEDHFDLILVGVLLLLAVAAIYLFAVA
jgi:hypothetical protein